MSLFGFPAQSKLLFLTIPLAPFPRATSPAKNGWIGASSGVRGLGFNYVVGKTECGCELYIDRGKDAAEETKSIFDQLIAHRSQIEGAFASALTWQRLDNRRACRIRFGIESGGYRSPEEEWPQVQDEVILAMDRLEKAVRPFLSRLNLKS